MPSDSYLHAPLCVEPTSGRLSEAASNEGPSAPEAFSTSACYISPINSFRLYRVFPIKLKRYPDEEDNDIQSHCDPTVFPSPPPLDCAGPQRILVEDGPPLYATFHNVSTFDLLAWQPHNNAIARVRPQRARAL